MTDRTLEANEIQDAIRRPSFELQQAAIAAGYGSVRDWVLDQCCTEIRQLKARVAALEKGRVSVCVDADELEDLGAED